MQESIVDTPPMASQAFEPLHIEPILALVKQNGENHFLVLYTQH